MPKLPGHALHEVHLRSNQGPCRDIGLVAVDRRWVGFFRLADIEAELSGLFGGRKIDLRTPMDLSRYFRDEVVRDALVVYAEA